MNTIKGKIKLIGDVKEYGSNGFTKREFVLTTEEKYPQEVKLELYKDDCEVLEDYDVGDSIEATFNIKGNEYKGNYYVNLQAWKLSSSSEENNSESKPEKKTKPNKQKEPELSESDLTENISELADAPF
jgi:single-strand DNA-binding protein